MVKYGWEICDDVQLHRGNIADMQFVERSEYQAIWDQLKDQLGGEVRQADWLLAERQANVELLACLNLLVRDTWQTSTLELRHRCERALAKAEGRES